MATGTFVLEQSKNGKVKFNLEAANHQVILTSELYEKKASALKGIESVRKNAAANRFDRRTAKNGSPYFVLLAANKEVIGTSEMHSSAAALERGIASVQSNAPDAKVVDKAA